MKKIISLAIALLMVPAFSMTASAIVEGDRDTSTSTDSSSTTSTTDETEKKARSTRVEEYKKAYKERLSTTVQKRIGERCVAAQGVIKTHTARLNTRAKLRNANYGGIISALENAATRLGESGLDVTALQANITELKSRVESFKTSLTDYQQALSDLEALDCKTDPTAFKAALETARTKQAATLQVAAGIKTYLQDTVKPTLKALKEQKQETE